MSPKPWEGVLCGLFFFASCAVFIAGCGACLRESNKFEAEFAEKWAKESKYCAAKCAPHGFENYQLRYGHGPRCRCELTSVYRE